jgi:hypothetical protein
MERKVITVNIDYVSLYPSAIKDWTKDEKFMAEMNEIKRKRVIEERKNKLERLNNFYEED